MQYSSTSMHRRRLWSGWLVAVLTLWAPLAQAQDLCGNWTIVPTPNPPFGNNARVASLVSGSGFLAPTVDGTRRRASAEDMDGVSADDIWIVGIADGTGNPTAGNELFTLHWDGGSWTRVGVTYS